MQNIIFRFSLRLASDTERFIRYLQCSIKFEEILSVSTCVVKGARITHVFRRFKSTKISIERTKFRVVAGYEALQPKIYR